MKDEDWPQYLKRSRAEIRKETTTGEVLSAFTSAWRVWLLVVALSVPLAVVCYMGHKKPAECTVQERLYPNE